MVQQKTTYFKPWHIIFFLVFVLAFFGVQFWQAQMPVIELTLAEEHLEVEIPRTRAQLIRGLGQRPEMGEYDGMLFVFDYPGKHAIVMRDMEFPIDIIWFYEGKVVDIAPNVQPEDVPERELTAYRPRVDATVVLEVSAGWAEEHGLKIGDQLLIRE